MSWSKTLRPSRALAVLVGSLAAALACGRAAAQSNGFAGQISYTGDLGPVGEQRPLCLCVYRNASLTDSIDTDPPSIPSTGKPTSSPFSLAPST